MADAIYTVVLDITDEGCIDTGWRLHQGDYGESQVVVKVVNNGVNMFDENVRPQITFRRSDGISIVGAMFIEDSTYKYNFYGNELEVPGIVLMDLKFIDSQGRTSTAAARFLVLPNTEGDTQEGSHTYINSGLVSELREDVEEVREYTSLTMENSLKSEGWAVGTQNGVPVSQDSEYYHNNSRWWSEQANPTRLGSLSDVSFGTLNDDEIAVYDNASEKWINEVGVSTDVKSVRIVQELAQFKTRTGGLLQSAVVSLEPNQDLHGYDKPWVGGSGKNKLSGLEQGSFDTYGNDVSATNRLRSKDFVPVNASTTYVISAQANASVRANIFEFNSIGSAYSVTSSWKALPFNFTTGASTSYVLVMVKFSDDANITPSDVVNPQIETGSTATTYEPYENICPISGHSSITFDNKRINLCPTFTSLVGDTQKYYAVVNDGIVTFRVKQDIGWVPTYDLNIARSAPVEVQSGVEYELSGLTSGGENKWWIEIRNESGSRLDTELGSYKVYDSRVTFTPTTTHKITIACMVRAGANAYGHSVTFTPMLINADEWYAEHSSAPRFVPYQPIEQQTVVELGRTVYGGSLDAVSGVGSTDEPLIDLGDLTWNGKDSSDRFYAEINDIKPNTTGDYTTGLIMCSAMEIDARVITSASSASDFTIAKFTDSGLKRIYVKCSSISSASDFKTAVTGIKLLYQKATASSFSTTPTNIETLIGQNNISVPLEGQTLDSLSYREMMAWDDVTDIVKAVDDKNADISAIGTDESGRTTASRSYTRGERFYKDGKYCRTKTAVAQGATWTLNTNYEETSIASEQRVQEESASVPSAMSSYVTINRQTIVRCGLVVSVAMQITVNSMPSNGGVILNMPFTNQGTAKFFGIYGGSSFSPTGTGVYISSDSYEVRCASAIPDGQHWISGTYIMKTY